MLRTSNSSSSYYKFSGLLAVALLGIATIIGSGGGGGGGGPAPDTSTPIVYSGVTTIATITPTNADPGRNRTPRRDRRDPDVRLRRQPQRDPARRRTRPNLPQT